jgi:hypothetical protein
MVNPIRTVQVGGLVPAPGSTEMVVQTDCVPLRVMGS